MTYHMDQLMDEASIDIVKEKVTAALKEEGFGILTEIDIQATMKKAGQRLPAHVDPGCLQPWVC